MARPDLSDALRGGLLGVAVGEALGLPWAGCAPRAIKRSRLYEDVGPTGAMVAGVLGTAGAPPLASALVVGWREADPLARRTAALPLGFSAVVVADLAAAALAGRPLHHLVTDHAEDWAPPFRGVADDGRAVVDALMAVLYRHDDPTEAMHAAVRLGGGGAAALTATVGGILGARRPTAIARVPWLARTAVPDEAALARAVAALSGPVQP